MNPLEKGVRKMDEHQKVTFTALEALTDLLRLLLQASRHRKLQREGGNFLS